MAVDFKHKVEFRDAMCVAETDKAILVEVGGKQYWIPHSQVDADSEVFQRNDTGTLVVSQWIAEQKGLV